MASIRDASSAGVACCARANEAMQRLMATAMHDAVGRVMEHLSCVGVDAVVTALQSTLGFRSRSPALPRIDATGHCSFA